MAHLSLRLLGPVVIPWVTKRRRLGLSNRLTGPGCDSLVRPGNPKNYVKTECFAVPTAPASFFTPIASAPMCTSDPIFGENAIGAAPQCLNLRGNAGRNIIPGPGLVNLDLSFFKNNPIRRISETSTCSSEPRYSTFSIAANFGVAYRSGQHRYF